MLHIEPLDDGVGLRLTGELADTGALVAEDAFARLPSRAGDVTIDMAGVDFMDSFGLGKLIVLAIGLAGHGQLRLTNVQPSVMRVFRLVSPGRGLAGMIVEPAPALPLEPEPAAT